MSFSQTRHIKLKPGIGSRSKMIPLAGMFGEHLHKDAQTMRFNSIFKKASMRKMVDLFRFGHMEFYFVMPNMKCAEK